jgi:hypothetical protein
MKEFIASGHSNNIRLELSKVNCWNFKKEKYEKLYLIEKRVGTGINPYSSLGTFEKTIRKVIQSVRRNTRGKYWWGLRAKEKQDIYRALRQLEDRLDA